MNCSKKDLYGLNPTAWKQIDENRWCRLEGY